MSPYHLSLCEWLNLSNEFIERYLLVGDKKILQDGLVSMEIPGELQETSMTLGPGHMFFIFSLSDPSS